MQADFDHHIAKIITAVNINSKKAAFNASQSILSTSSTSFEVYKRHMDDQEKLLGGLFESSKQLQIFKHNLKLQCMDNLTGNKSCTSPQGSTKKCSPKDPTTVKNIYIMLWKAFAHPIKTAMQTIADDNETDGP
eukprot:12051956-Ditylum_brightwellii.AAC.1